MPNDAEADELINQFCNYINVDLGSSEGDDDVNGDDDEADGDVNVTEADVTVNIPASLDQSVKDKIEKARAEMVEAKEQLLPFMETRDGMRTKLKKVRKYLSLLKKRRGGSAQLGGRTQKA